MSETHKYEINGYEFEMDRSLTDKELRDSFNLTAPLFDDGKWRHHGVAQRGTFLADGMPTHWVQDSSLICDGRGDAFLLEIMDNGDVLLRGEFNKELTEERARCMSPARI